MTNSTLFSRQWFRVKDVKPRLAADVDITRHVYRSRPTWVLRRRTNGACHRVGAASFELIDRLDGMRSVGELWEQALRERDQDAPTQDEWMQVLAELQSAELLLVDSEIPAEQLFERRDRKRQRDLKEKHLNPLYVRFSLFDPDDLLNRSQLLRRIIFSRAAAVLWCLLVLAGVLALLGHGDEFSASLADDSLLSPSMMILFAVLYPIMKLVHEIAHALAVKHYGGEVHQCGIALMVLMPLPFVDASDSASFVRKRHRIVVSAAGILVELAFAAIGALLWVSTGGIIKDFGLSLMLIGFVSTLLINGNPLLRFDGYYVLADVLEIPNLATRGRRAVLLGLRRWLCGQPRATAYVEDSWERFWLVSYGLCSAVYRFGLMLWISWWLYSRFPLLGVLLGTYTLAMILVFPVGKALRALARDPDLQAPRPVSLIATLPLLMVASVFWVPFPYASTVQGVVWLPEDAVLRAETDCEISSSRFGPGHSVHVGQELYTCHNPELSLQELELLARLDESNARRRAMAVVDPLEHERLLAEKRSIVLALKRVREQRSRQIHRARVNGQLDVPGTSAMQGRALTRGEVVAYVVPPDERSVRVALDQPTVEAIDRTLQQVQVRVESAKTQVHSTQIISRTPRPSVELMSPALGIEGGGDHATEPGSDGKRALHPLFDVELAWPDALDQVPVGTHVHVRFEHVAEPLAPRLFTGIRRLFEDQRGV